MFRKGMTAIEGLPGTASPSLSAVTSDLGFDRTRASTLAITLLHADASCAPIQSAKLTHSIVSKGIGKRAPSSVNP